MTTRRHAAKDKRIPDACPALGIIDWGIGGLGFFKLLRSRRPDVAITYFSDSGEVPYGRLSKERLASRLDLILRFLRQRGVIRLVVACNAMSTVLPLRATGRAQLVSTVGVIEPTIDSLRAAPYKRYGVIGGRRTVLSGVYRDRLKGSGRMVTQRIAQSISRLIEDGKTGSSELVAALAEIVRPLRNAEALILGCTHYSAVNRQFVKLLPDAVLIDPAALTLAWIERNWKLSPSAGPDVFFTTGSIPLMRMAARRAFAIDPGDICKLDVDIRRYILQAR